MRVLLVEDEPYMADAIRDGLRLEAIAADIAGDGDTALELLNVNGYDIAVLDRDIPGPSGDEIAERIVASGSGMPILMLTAADRLDGRCCRRGRGRQQLVAENGDRRDDHQQAGDTDPAQPGPAGLSSCPVAVGHARIQGSVALRARIWFSICRRHAAARTIGPCVC